MIEQICHRIKRYSRIEIQKKTYTIEHKKLRCCHLQFAYRIWTYGNVV